MSDAMTKSLLHVGYFANRLQNRRLNCYEVAYAEVWHRENNRLTGDLLDCLLPGFTVETSRVAATVIQWLGTDAGQGFLRKVGKEIEQGRAKA